MTSLMLLNFKLGYRIQISWQSLFRNFITLLMIFFNTQLCAGWKKISPGIEYQDMSPHYLSDWSHIHLFKISVGKYEFKLVNHQQLGVRFPSIEQYAKFKNAPLAFNGGFFDLRHRPLGLRISESKQTNAFKNISWWGVFRIQHQTASIESAKNFKLYPIPEFAIQSGPRLIIDKHIPSLRPGYAERTALCVLSNDEIAVIITQNFPMTLKQLAITLQGPPLNCQNALNLDGGSSTQFFAKFPHLFLHMPGLVSVSDAIIVSPRKN